MDERHTGGSQASAEGAQASPGEQAAVRWIIKEDHAAHAVRSALLRAVPQPSGDGKHMLADWISHSRRVEEYARYRTLRHPRFASDPGL